MTSDVYIYVLANMWIHYFDSWQELHFLLEQMPALGFLNCCSRDKMPYSPCSSETIIMPAFVRVRLRVSVSQFHVHVYKNMYTYVCVYKCLLSELQSEAFAQWLCSSNVFFVMSQTIGVSVGPALEFWDPDIHLAFTYLMAPLLLGYTIWASLEDNNEDSLHALIVSETER